MSRQGGHTRSRAAATPLEQRWPVVEVFGPTLQGEGVDQGVPAHFIRFGGCDYRCDWCDTPYAVLPKEVRENATRMSSSDIRYKLKGLDMILDPAEPTGSEDAVLDYRPAPWIILTGGNPALHDLSQLVMELQEEGYLVAVETQGSRWRNWMVQVDRLCVSPKPPSAKEKKAGDLTPLSRFLHEGLEAKALNKRPYEWCFIKIPIFNDADLDYAEDIRAQFGDFLLYLSAGNDAGRTVGSPDRVDERGITEIRTDLMRRSLWLTEEVFNRPALCQHDVIVQSQYHVLLWGNQQGR